MPAHAGGESINCQLLTRRGRMGRMEGGGTRSGLNTISITLDLIRSKSRHCAPSDHGNRTPDYKHCSLTPTCLLFPPSLFPLKKRTDRKVTIDFGLNVSVLKGRKISLISYDYSSFKNEREKKLEITVETRRGREKAT